MQRYAFFCKHPLHFRKFIILPALSPLFCVTLHPENKNKKQTIMIQSMTGYGKVVVVYKDKKISAEIKSLNSKQLDLQTRIAPLYREKEMEIRQLVAASLERGKVDFSLWIRIMRSLASVSSFWRCISSCLHLQVQGRVRSFPKIMRRHWTGVWHFSQYNRPSSARYSPSLGSDLASIWSKSLSMNSFISSLRRQTDNCHDRTALPVWSSLHLALPSCGSWPDGSCRSCRSMPYTRTGAQYASDNRSDIPS